MISRCLEGESRVRVVWVADDGLREVGCAWEFAEVLETMGTTGA